MRVLCFLFVLAEMASVVSAQDGDEQARAPLAGEVLRPTTRVLSSWPEALGLLRRTTIDYRQALARVHRADAARGAARAALVPSLNARATYTHQFVTDVISVGRGPVSTPVPDVGTLGATASWAVGDGAAYYALGTAADQARLARDDLAAVRRVLAASLVDALLAVIAGERQNEIAVDVLRAAESRVALSQAQLRHGRGLPVDVDRALQDVELAKAELVQARERVERARDGLGLLLGFGAPVGVSRGLHRQSVAAAIERDCERHLSIEQRADVVAARRRVALAARGIGQAEWEYVPRILVSSTAAYNSQVAFGPKFTLDVGAVLTGSLFDGGARAARIAGAKAAVEEASVELERVRAQARLEVEQTERGIAVASATQAALGARRERAVRVEERTRTAFASGLATSFELVAAGQELRRAELELLQSEIAVWRAEALRLLALRECAF